MLAYWIPTENRYVRTQGEARKLGFGDETDIPTDKDGLLGFINGIHARPAEPPEAVYGVPESAPAPATSYTDASVNLDEAFMAAPLGQRLTLASIALEDARNTLNGRSVESRAENQARPASADGPDGEPLA